MKMQRFALALSASLLAFGITTSAALAQDNVMLQGNKEIAVATVGSIVTDKEAEKAVREGTQRETGWYPKLRIGGSAALNYNKDVNGITNGTAFTFGVFIKGALDGIYKNLEWQNKLDIEHQQTKTPNIDSFIKSADLLDFSTLLLFRIPKVEWLGPYARFRLQTSIFPGYYTAEDDTIVRFFKSGTDIDDKPLTSIIRASEVAAQESIKMSSAFEPILLSEAVGIFMNPYTSDPFTIDIKVGAAGQHLLMRDGYVAFDNDDKDEYYDVIQLKTTHSAGIEGAIELKGVFVSQVNWSILGGIYYPFAVSDDQDLSGTKLIHADVTGKISVKIASWASLDYTLNAKLAPFVTTKWQISNTLLFNMGFDIFQ